MNAGYGKNWRRFQSLIQEPDQFHHEGTKDTKPHSRHQILKISRKDAKKWEINGEILAEEKLSAAELYKDWERPVTKLPILVTDSLITDY